MAVGKRSSVAAWKAQHEKGQVYLLSFRKHRSHLFDHGSWFRILSIQIPVVQRDFLQQTSLLVITLDVLWLELLLDSLRTSARHFFEYHHNASDCMTTVAKSRWFVMIRYIDCIFWHVSYFSCSKLGKGNCNFESLDFETGSCKLPAFFVLVRFVLGRKNMDGEYGDVSRSRNSFKYVQGGWRVTEHFSKQLMTFLSWNANLRVTSSGQPSPPLLRLLPPSEEDRKANQRNNCVKAFQTHKLLHTLCISLHSV